jgi:hypothetical protein
MTVWIKRVHSGHFPPSASKSVSSQTRTHAPQQSAAIDHLVGWIATRAPPLCTTNSGGATRVTGGRTLRQRRRFSRRSAFKRTAGADRGLNVPKGCRERALSPRVEVADELLVQR